MTLTQILTCSTCDDYRLTEGPDGMLERCPDCMEHCLAHPCERVLGGRCPSCVTEASVAVEMLYAARRAVALATIGAAAA